MPGPGWLTGKGFVSVNDVGKDNPFSNVGGRVDLRKEINEIKFTASITDATARDYEAAPWLKDSIITAEKRLNSKLPVTNPLCHALSVQHSAYQDIASQTGRSACLHKLRLASCQMYRCFKLSV